MKNLFTFYGEACGTDSLGQYTPEDWDKNQPPFMTTGLYFDSKLEDKIGYDIVYHRYTEETWNESIALIPKGKYKCCVKANGEEIEAIAYVWDGRDKGAKYNNLRGFVVLPSDTDAIEYAEKKYAARAQCL